MHPVSAFFVMFLMLGISLFGQSKPETVEFIIREMKSCENDVLEMKDVDFSDGYGTCKIKTGVPGQLNEKSLEFTLSEVDIFTSTKIVKTGKDEYIYVYSLLASPRGRNGGIRKNLSRNAGTEIILQNILNGEKVKGLELAFAHLTELITGQRKLFKSIISVTSASATVQP
jgi:hypothetical protein